MSFATALNMICNTQKHTLKLKRKDIKTYLWQPGLEEMEVFLYIL